MFKEFKEFAMKGNIIDMAVGVVIGGAFGKIVTSLVNDIIMPLVGKITGGVNFNDLFISLNGVDYNTLAEAQAASAPTLNYGSFIGSVVDFLIISFSIFMVLRQINKVNILKKEEPVKEVTTKICPYCITEIDIKASRCPNCTSELN